VIDVLSKLGVIIYFVEHLLLIFLQIYVIFNGPFPLVSSGVFETGDLLNFNTL